jgi:hypothetical protein
VTKFLKVQSSVKKILGNIEKGIAAGDMHNFSFDKSPNSQTLYTKEEFCECACSPPTTWGKSDKCPEDTVHSVWQLA